LPFGGEVEARWITAATHQLVDIVGERTQRSSDLILSANIPLLRDAGLIAQEEIIQAERELVYAARSFERFRREFLVDIARDYFDLVAGQDNIDNQEQRLRSVIALKEQREALVEAGRRAAFEVRNVEQNVSRSQATLSNSQDQFQLAKDRFKVRLGLPIDVDLNILPVTIILPEPSVGVSEAASIALRYRLDYQNTVDRIGDFKRGVENAKNQLLPDLDINATAAFGNEDDGNIKGDLAPAYDLNDTDYALGITFGLPLDREIERLGLRQATIQLGRAERNLSQTRDLLIVDARAAVREIERARFALELQELAIKTNELRLYQLELDADQIDAQVKLDAENELLQSRNDRDAALRDLRVAILNYLLVTGQMRVNPDGTFQPLQGMIVREAAPVDGAPDEGIDEELLDPREGTDDGPPAGPDAEPGPVDPAPPGEPDPE
jgi:outer membrane protein TolC